ncbi:MAG: glycosyltransferase family 2 protein [Rikenellaceae bacterium]|nr:glycosyltransferase family 2 protein [Rikenellaceae bacterium]
MEKNKLSAVLITYNEEQNIRKTLQSLGFADEIVIVDSLSTDDTVRIAREYTDKIFTRRFDNFSSQRNFSLEQAVCDWVLVMDADEIVTPELQREILQFLASETVELCAVSIGRDNIFMDRVLRHSGAGGDHVIRMFPKNIHYKNEVHEVPDVGGLPVKKFRSRIIHNTYRSYGHTLEKYDHYAKLHAVQMYRNGYKVTLGKLLLKPGFRFFRHYILKLGFLDGKQGLIFSYLSARGVFDKLVRTWRMQNGEEL